MIAAAATAAAATAAAVATAATDAASHPCSLLFPHAHTCSRKFNPHPVHVAAVDGFANAAAAAAPSSAAVLRCALLRCCATFNVCVIVI